MTLSITTLYDDECCSLFIFMLNAILLNVVRLNVVMLNVVATMFVIEHTQQPKCNSILEQQIF